MLKRLLAAVVVLGFLALAITWYFKRGNAQTASYRTEQVTRGNLLVSIRATGTVEPEEVLTWAHRSPARSSPSEGRERQDR